ncbi:sulfotransferase domain-containing protein [Streptomyces aureoversilis]|uniref:Sulfotransferase domain-containing protein n=1 Tax=Streptomyces aureoversilis TaxID=67277 RepID=A0ABV9ZXF0_9ACTN
MSGLRAHRAVHMLSWWELRHESGVFLLHYQNLLDDLEGQMRHVAACRGSSTAA